MAEQLICNQRVGGSIPFGGSTCIARGCGKASTSRFSLDGEVPEWPKGTGCKPVGSAFGGSNPPLSTSPPVLRGFDSCEVQCLENKRCEMRE